MVQAVIFDCFGVLVTEGLLSYAEAHFKDDSLRWQLHDLITTLNKGMLGYDDFILRVAELAGDDPGAVRRQIMGNVPNRPLLDYVRTSLKPKYRLGVLSNAGSNRLPELLGPEEDSLFDATALSYETGFIKPQPAAYAQIAGRLGVDARDCIYVDDQEHHCNGAREAGMQAILYTDFAQFRHDLEKLLSRSGA